MASDDDEVPQTFFFNTSGTGNGVWEINRPQTAIPKLVEHGIFHGEVLDIGCGIGDNAIYIAKHTSNVSITATDLVPKAIEVAREKAQQANVNIRFEVADMIADLSTTNLKQNSYDVIFEAAVFHAFSNKDRLIYIKNLESLIKPNGLYIQLCFSEKETREGGPRRIKKSDLYELFSSQNGWTIESIEDDVYETTLFGSVPSGGRAYLSTIRRNNYT
ncbi:unnamed protein product [Rotaria magnacalcarata]|uniref:Methyltransferase domain-containing protein n=1 Tax=Rotaria magnacalcarata TaxID=392030 RepID=A0A819DSD2_9BILA|nr:unnamed protein product [Rotaria magnacalcarata]CAF2107944.1 unnamed protein product [Rotaria magnacalcarata]CAF3831815.1 unnamed protein product [Rotaria magnacalcarata]CAF3868670.1 unnamed protein product [Rotaria magnacalcarata]